MAQCVFLDTNIFLHYQPIDHIDWLGILGTKSVILIVSTTVIRELNRHKDFPSSTKTRERAAAALTKLDAWSDQKQPVMIRPSVEFQFRERDPVINFGAEHLSQDIPDDHLIATIIEHRAENGGDAILITADLGLKLKARSHQILPVQLPAELRLADEPLESEKRIRHLESEVRRLQNATPKLRLLFKTPKENRIHLALDTTENADPDDVDSSLTKIRSQYPRMEHPKLDATLTAEAGTLVVPQIWSVSADEIERYNAELEAYLTSFEEHLQRLQFLRDLRGRTLRIDLIITNEGSCPAEDVLIDMHFPDGFSLIKEGQLPKTPNAPDPPARAKTELERKTQGFQLPNLYPTRDIRSLANLGTPTPRNVSSPAIRRTNSFDVRVHVTKINHGFAESLDPLFIIFDTIEGARSFQIDYEIHAANLIEPVQGPLHVILDKGAVGGPENPMAA